MMKARLSSQFMIILAFYVAWMCITLFVFNRQSVTGWDTHDLGWVNFIYFSDAIRSGILPLWNHYLQSGIFYPSWNNIGWFSPLGILSVVLSQFWNPLWVFEGLVQTIVFIGVYGCYRFLYSRTNHHWIAIFGASGYWAVLTPIVGQLGMLASLSMLPWFLTCANRLANDKQASYGLYSLLGIFIGSQMTLGYLWMNFVNMCVMIGFFSSVSYTDWASGPGEFWQSYKIRLINFSFFVISLSCVYILLLLPGYHQMQDQYALLSGDYRSPEPRLRSMAGHLASYSYHGFFKSVLTAIDPRIYMNNADWVSKIHTWSMGAGWPLWLLFFGLIDHKKSPQRIFWLSILVIGLLYSAAKHNLVGWIASHIPILQGNRWLMLGTFYVMISLIFLVTQRLSVNWHSTYQRKDYAWLWLIVVAAGLILMSFSAPLSQYLIVFCSGVLIQAYMMTAGQIGRVIALCGLLLLSVVSALTNNTGAERYRQLTPEMAVSYDHRNQSVDINENYRRLGHAQAYIYNDEDWIINKTPFSHGYNNLGNPFYWYVKDDPSLAQMMFITQNVRPELPIFRENYATDNDFAQSLMADVSSNMSNPSVSTHIENEGVIDPAFTSSITSLSILPNQAKAEVSVSAPAYLVFNNVDAKGWQVFVDGAEAPLLKLNRIFQGVFIDESGIHQIEFRFNPPWVKEILLLPYILLFVGSLSILLNRARKRLQVRTHLFP